MHYHDKQRLVQCLWPGHPGGLFFSVLQVAYMTTVTADIPKRLNTVTTSGHADLPCPLEGLLVSIFDPMAKDTFQSLTPSKDYNNYLNL